MNNPIAWMNGQLLPFEQTSLPVWDLGVVAGASITEMARTFAHRPFRLEQHLQRLIRSCSALGLHLPYENQQLQDLASRVLEHNTRLIHRQSDLGIVVFVTAGTNATYLASAGDSVSRQGTVAIHTFELPFSMWQSAIQEGLRLRIPSRRQLPSDSFPVEHKVRNRLHWILADRDADAAEPGAKALLLNRDGYITETSTACFYGVINGVIVTSDRDVLHSMSCQVVQELARDLDIPFARRPLQLDDIPKFSEAFVSSTPCCLLPVHQINGRQVGESPASASKVFRALMKSWSEMAGVEIEHQILNAGPSQ
ncbi:MAG: aminotransferase class IV [Planctomycetaceae bacterium]